MTVEGGRRAAGRAAAPRAARGSAASAEVGVNQGGVKRRLLLRGDAEAAALRALARLQSESLPVLQAVGPVPRFHGVVPDVAVPRAGVSEGADGEAAGGAVAAGPTALRHRSQRIHWF